MPEAETLFECQDLYLGELRCPRDDDTWDEDADVTHPIVALPCSPTWVVRHGTVRHLANANHAVVHQNGDVYRRERFESRGYRCLFLFPSDSLFREVAAEFDRSATDVPAYRLPINLTSFPGSAFSLSRHLAGYLHTEPSPDPVMVMEAVYEILRSVIAGAYRHRVPAASPAERPATRRAHSEIAEEAKASLTARFTERLTIGDLASAIHVSPYHLARVFRRQTGFALHEYVNQLRLRAALERIRGGQNDLAALAVELGFSSHSHMSFNFRRAFGHRPSGTRSHRAPWVTGSSDRDGAKRARN
jgi:AraC family transcriptional regulator